MISDALVNIVALTVAVAFPCYLLLRFIVARHTERMTVIERGLDPAIYFARRAADKMSSLKWGLLAMFAGLGWLIGAIIMPNLHSKLQDFIIPATILIGCGLGLLLYYFIAAKKKGE